MSLPLSGLLVVALEQAVAAPMCTCRLADAGARVIKIERPEGDFARGYDKLAKPHTDGRERRSKQEDARERAGVKQEDARERADVKHEDARERADVTHEDGRERPDGAGESAYFVWLNRGKQSLVLDLARDDDKAVLAAMLAKADVFVQNLKPGAIAKLGFPLDQLRRTHPRLVICSISGYGEDGPYAARKAYDMLIQAESGLASLTGSPDAPARVGVSVCDIAAGMNAYEAILEALIARGRTGDGAAISISMFDAMADWMAVPLLQYEGGQPPRRMGLAHTSIAPYGVFKTADGADILISIQSDREWRVLAAQVLGDSALAADPAFATNVARVKRRADTDARVQAGVRRHRRCAADAEARRRRHRLCPRQRHRRPRRPSAAAPHRGRDAVGRGVLSRAARAPRRRPSQLRRGARARRAQRRDPRRVHAAGAAAVGWAASLVCLLMVRSVAQRRVSNHEASSWPPILRDGRCAPSSG